MVVRLSSCAKHQKWNEKKDKYVACLPPPNLVNAVFSSTEYPGIPVATGDGTYSGLLEPHDAVKLLDDLLVDFPFATPAHRSGWYAALVSLLSRAAFADSAPFFLFDANTSRVGKGLLTDLIAVISEGRRASRYSASKDGDEMRKAITTAAISGVPCLLFDNIKGKFGGATLENAMTAGQWTDRVIGVMPLFPALRTGRMDSSTRPLHIMPAELRIMAILLNLPSDNPRCLKNAASSQPAKRSRRCSRELTWGGPISRWAWSMTWAARSTG